MSSDALSTINPSRPQHVQNQVHAYLRVSTDGQGESGAGLSAQLHDVQRWCDSRGLELGETHTEILSGRSLNRPILTCLLASLGAGDTLVVAKLDRLSRSTIDAVGLIARAQREKWNLVALDLGIDLSTPQGEFMATVMAAMAQWERRLISQRTKDALAARKAQGVRLGRPRVMSDQLHSLIRELSAAGWPRARIARFLNDAGVSTVAGGVRWWPSTIARVLQ